MIQTLAIIGGAVIAIALAVGIAALVEILGKRAQNNLSNKE